MAIQEKDEVPTHFYRAIRSLKNARMKIASKFLEYHGSTISDHVICQVDHGSSTWVFGVERCEGQVWLVDGWKTFVDYYSIKFRYILMFRYKGKSKFDVFIYDPSLMEIQYPGKASSKRGVQFDQSEDVETDEEESDDENDDDDDDDDEEEEDDDDDDDDDDDEDDEDEEEEDEHEDEDDEEECRQRLQKTREKSHTKKFNEKRTQTMDAWIRVHARAKCIPAEHSRKHILGKENRGMVLLEEDGRRWSVNYHIGKDLQVRLLSCGWKDFAKKNHLQFGDVCVFELIDCMNMVYKVTVFRIADYEEEEEADDDDDGYECFQRLEKSRENSLCKKCSKKRTRRTMNACTRVHHARAKAFKSSNPCQTSQKRSHSRRATKIVQQKAKAFRCENPSFTVVIRQYHLGRKTSLYVPVKHGREYLLEKGDGEMCLRIGDKTWDVTYAIEGPPLNRVRLSAYGWRPFAKVNRLEVGDACVFELVDGAKMIHEVTIFRVADYA